MFLGRAKNITRDMRILGKGTHFTKDMYWKHISLVICVPPIPSDMCSPTWETHIPSNMCSPTWETHTPSDMCSPNWETHIPSDMCSSVWKTHIPSDVCSPT